MEWLTDPAIWIGLLTLVLLEVVLGIDNLIFIAILADKLSPHQRDRARQIGLILAMLMRLGLLASLSWLMTLTSPLFTVLRQEISGRDLILILGGLFLLLKATMEIHDRLEPEPQERTGEVVHAGFWGVIAQIVVLDVVFSLDSVITAVGMVDELLLMMAAVVIAMAVMIAASKPLTTFINARPSLIILCLGLLLMVGFSLIADGFDFHIPKGYLYAAIAFSLLIETFNQIALGKRRKWIASLPPRQRVANTVLRLLAGVPVPAPIANAELNALVVEGDKQDAFATAEKDMVRGVLTLADRPVSTIMTPRPDVEWIDADDSKEAVLTKIRNSHHRQFLVSRGSIENVVGIARKEDILALYLDDGPFDLKAIAHPPLAAHEGISILQMLDLFKKAPVEMAIVVDEYGELEGVVTQTDLLEAIAGDLPQAENEEPEVKKLEDGALLVNGAMSVYDAQTRLGLGSVPAGDFDTLAGLVLFLLCRIPTVGDRTEWQGWRFEVSAMDGHRIDQVLVKRTGQDEQ